jgi:phosphate transport system substrate-binding protein
VALAAALVGGCNAGSAVDIVVSGSSTVEPISALVAQAFVQDVRGVAITVDGPGTGDGFERFCNGEADISDASRPIKEEEVESCEANGIDFVELQVAVDGITVLTSPRNTVTDCLHLLDLYALFGPESQGFDRWSDANDLAAELGAPNAPYPDVPLVVTGPGEESGTFDTFVELTIDEIADERGQEGETRPDYTSSPNDNVIVEGVTGNATALGWVGYAFYEESRDIVRALAIDGGEGCVEPTEETISEGTYPLARPLFIYVNTDTAAESEALQSYVDLYLSDTGLSDLVEQAGYVPLAEDDVAATRAAWEVAVG